MVQPLLCPGMMAPSALLLTLFLLVGCGSPERPKIITISKAPVFRPSSSTDVRSIEQAMAAVITVCRDDLALPAVDPLTVYLYPNTTSFAHYMYGREKTPDDVIVTAIARPNEIHVNMEVLAQLPFGEWLDVLAHEYGHNIHSVTGNLETSSPWFAEGFAEWVQARVLHSLKWQDYDIAVHRASKELLHNRATLTRLSWLKDYQNWHNVVGPPNRNIRTYKLAFYAVHQMVEGQDPDTAARSLISKNFEARFSQAKFDKHLLLLERKKSRVPFKVHKPQWKIGDQWVFSKKSFGKVTTVEREVLRETNLFGQASILVKVGDSVNVYASDNLGLLGMMKGEKVVYRSVNSDQFLSWPLELNKQWINSYIIAYPEQKKTLKVERNMVVSGLEQITVPAGTFETVKIEEYDSESGTLIVEFWYSPRAKWMVKIRNYAGDFGPREDELVSFKVD